MDPPGFRRLKWRMLLAAMFCYLFYYLGRLTFGWAIPQIRAELALSNQQVGWISSAFLWAYGAGQFVNGNLGDKLGGRRMATAGAVLSTLLTWSVSFGQSLWMLLVPWAANGYAQSLGWAPFCRLVSNWWPRRERGLAFGLLVFAAGGSTVLSYAVSIFGIENMDWRWLFRVPVTFLLGAGVVFFLVARDRPEDLGHAPLPEEDEVGPTAPPEHETFWERYGAVLRHRRFLLACLAVGFESFCRYALVLWVPDHYLGDDAKGSLWTTLALPVGMAFGALTTGYVSDRFFGSNRSRPIAWCMMLAAAVCLLMYWVPTEATALGVGLLFLAGFLVYGPQASFWALCPDLLGKERAGTGVGVMNAAAYLVAGLEGPIVGGALDATGTTSSVFAVVAVAAIAGAACALLVNK